MVQILTKHDATKSRHNREQPAQVAVKVYRLYGASIANVTVIHWLFASFQPIAFNFALEWL